MDKWAQVLDEILKVGIFPRYTSTLIFIHIHKTLKTMAFSKAHRFPTADYHLSLICHALSHPARIQILRKLVKEKKCSAKQIHNGLPLSKNTVSQHLKVLRDMNIIHCEQVYPTVFYWLNDSLPQTSDSIVRMVMDQIFHHEPTITVEVVALSERRQVAAAGI